MATASPQADQAGVRLSVGGPLSAGEAAAVLALVQRAADEDGVSPLSEHVMLHLRYGGDQLARNVRLWKDGTLAGYGHLDPTDPVEGPAGEMVIDPPMRRQGLGLILGEALVAEAGEAGLRLWAHGELPAAARLAAAAGFVRVAGPLADAPLAAGQNRQVPAGRRADGADVRPGPGRAGVGPAQPPRVRPAPGAGCLDRR